MVKIQGPSDYDRLDALVHRLVDQHGLRLDETGWTRKTYDIYARTPPREPGRLLARLESFATTSGEILVFDEGAMPFAVELGAELEKEFGIQEAVVLRR